MNTIERHKEGLRILMLVVARLGAIQRLVGIQAVAKRIKTTKAVPTAEKVMRTLLKDMDA